MGKTVCITTSETGFNHLVGAGFGHKLLALDIDDHGHVHPLGIVLDIFNGLLETVSDIDDILIYLFSLLLISSLLLLLLSW